jgi:hypothetical protein
MGDTENARARKEAVEAAARAGSGANRQRLWAGMNRYLAAETEHAHRTAEQEAAEQQTAVQEDTDEATRAADRPDRGDGPA